MSLWWYLDGSRAQRDVVLEALAGHTNYASWAAEEERRFKRVIDHLMFITLRTMHVYSFMYKTYKNVMVEIRQYCVTELLRNNKAAQYLCSSAHVSRCKYWGYNTHALFENSSRRGQAHHVTTFCGLNICGDLHAICAIARSRNK